MYQPCFFRFFFVDRTSSRKLEFRFDFFEAGRGLLSSELLSSIDLSLALLDFPLGAAFEIWSTLPSSELSSSSGPSVAEVLGCGGFFLGGAALGMAAPFPRSCRFSLSIADRSPGCALACAVAPTPSLRSLAGYATRVAAADNSGTGVNISSSSITFSGAKPGFVAGEDSRGASHEATSL